MTGYQYQHQDEKPGDMPGHVYFEVESDKDLQSYSAGQNTLTWRGDPDETFSDWSIVIVTSELEAKTYHVHKSVMCFGSRSSAFFRRVMTKGSSKKKAKKTGNSTKVELDHRDVDNFPVLLDFMYARSGQITATGTFLSTSSSLSSSSTLAFSESTASQGSTMEGLTSQNAVSLRFLARKFEVEAMMTEVNKFIQKDLTLKTGPIYLCSSSEYNDERLMESAQRLCAENFDQLDMRLLMKLPLTLFRTVVNSLESFDGENKRLSLFVSEVVCRYLEKYPESLSASLLLELTDSLVMPYIASEAAIGFTALIKELKHDEADKHYKELVGLSRRCARSVVQEYGWSDFSASAAADEYLGHTSEGMDERHEVTRIDSLLFATSFAAALEQAQDDYHAVVVEQSRLEEMIGSLHEVITRMEGINLRQDDRLTKQQEAIEQAKKQILALKGQIGIIKRNQNASPSPSRPKPMDAPDIVNDLNRSYPLSRSPNRSPLRPTQDAAIRDLVSPSRITVDHKEKTKRKQELRTKAQMRSRSILV